MVARVSLDDIIIYANEALAAYLGTPKRNLVGSSLPEDVAALQRRGFILLCTSRKRTHEQSARFRRGWQDL